MQTSCNKKALRKQSREGAARRAATERLKHNLPNLSTPHIARAARDRSFQHPPPRVSPLPYPRASPRPWPRISRRLPQRVSHRACAMAASHPCPLRPPTGFPSALAEGCIPPVPPPNPQTLAPHPPPKPQTAILRNEPKPAAPKQSRAGAARRAATKRFKRNLPNLPTPPIAPQARPVRRLPQRVSHRACAMAASQLCPVQPLNRPAAASHLCALA